MSDGSLSQEEIDALLMGSGGDAGAGGGAEQPAGGPLSPQQMQEFETFIGSNMGTMAGNLTNVAGQPFDLKSPSVSVVDRGELVGGLADNVVEVQVDFQDGISGYHAYIMEPDVAVSIAQLMMGQDQVELNEASLDALREAGSTMAGSTATAISDKVALDVMTAPGDASSAGKEELKCPEGQVVRVVYQITVDGNPPAEMVEVYNLPAAQAIAGSGGPEPAAADPMADLAGMANMAGGGSPAGGMPGMGQQQPMAGGMGMAPQGGFSNQPAPNVQSLQFPALNPQSAAGEQGNIGLIMDVYMEMTVELGRTRKLIREILGMGEGTIIELDKLAGEPVDILVNHKLIAKGEVVVIDENFGVRVTEIVSPMDRVEEIT